MKAAPLGSTRRLLALAALLVAGCSTGPGRHDGADGGPAPDGSVTDGPPDAADATDAAYACVPSGVCDPFSRTAAGCDGGQVCIPPASPSPTACFTEAASPKQENEPCGQQECVPGTGCLDTFDYQYMYDFRCQRLCPRGSRGFCGPGRQCAGDIFGGDYCVWNCVPIRPHCDLYAQDCADPADECTLAENVETGEHYTGCYPVGMTAEGQPCPSELSHDCAKGLVCAYIANLYACTRACRPGGSPACPAGQTCSGTFPLWDISYCQ